MPEPSEFFAQFLIGQALLDAFLRQAQDAVECQVSGRPTSVLPVLAVLTRDARDGAPEEMIAFGIAADFNEHDDKHAILRGCGKQVYEMRKVPLAAALSSEAWLSEQRVGGPRMEPRHDPARQEGVVVMALGLDRKTAAFSRALVTRDPRGRITLGPWERPEGEAVTSPLLDSFFRGFVEAAQAATAGRN